MSLIRYVNPLSYYVYIRSFIKRYKKLNSIVLDFPPSYATILVNDVCSNKCVFCVYHNPESEKCEVTKGFYGSKLRMNFTEFKNIVDVLVKNKVQRIHICANGEPFLNKNICNYIDYVISKGAVVSLQTNFQEHTFRYLEEIAKRKILFLGTDIVGGTKESFEHMKIGSKWELLFESIDTLNQYCKKHNNLIPIHAYCVVSRQSCDNVKELVKKCAEHGNIKCIYFHNLHPFGFNEFTQFKNVIRDTDTHIKRIIQFAVRFGREHGITVVEPAYFKDIKKFNCKNFWSRIMINHPDSGLSGKEILGNVRPGGCMYGMLGKDRYLGNILTDNFESIWNNPNLINARKLSLNGQFPDEYCRKCPAHYR